MMALSKLVLPDPFGPTIVTISLAAIRNDTSDSAVLAP
jgi:hypothetical protein